MKIECLIRRPEGSVCDMPAAAGKTMRVHFRPESAALRPRTEAFMEAPHVAEVTAIAHQRRFLMEIPGAFVPFGEAAVKEATERFGWPPKPVEAEKPALAAGQLPIVDEILDDDDDGDGDDTGEDDGDGENDGADPADADGDGETTDAELLAWAQANLAGVTAWDNKRELKKQLDQYAAKNHGKDLDQRKPVEALLREIYVLETA